MSGIEFNIPLRKFRMAMSKAHMEPVPLNNPTTEALNYSTQYNTSWKTIAEKMRNQIKTKYPHLQVEWTSSQFIISPSEPNAILKSEERSYLGNFLLNNSATYLMADDTNISSEKIVCNVSYLL